MDNLMEDTFETYVQDHVAENAYLLLDTGDVYRTYEIPTFLLFAYSPATIWIRRAQVGKNITLEAHGPFDVKIVLEVQDFKRQPAVTSKIDELMRWAKAEGKTTQPSVLKK